VGGGRRQLGQQSPSTTVGTASPEHRGVSTTQRATCSGVHVLSTRLHDAQHRAVDTTGSSPFKQTGAAFTQALKLSDEHVVDPLGGLLAGGTHVLQHEVALNSAPTPVAHMGGTTAAHAAFFCIIAIITGRGISTTHATVISTSGVCTRTTDW